MRGESVKAFVVLRPGMTATEAELKTFCRERLAPYKVPSEFEVVASCRSRTSGKCSAAPSSGDRCVGG
jgi:long-chain acyl-CoA synthetase